MDEPLDKAEEAKKKKSKKKKKADEPGPLEEPTPVIETPAVEEPAEADDPMDEAKKKKRRPKKKKAGDAPADPENELPSSAVSDPQPMVDDAPALAQSAAEPSWLAEREDWVDITAECGLAVAGLESGEMIESPHFRLLDAMSAVEIMDPKMDSGFNSGEDMTLDRAFEQGVVSVQLSVEQMVEIWDQLLMYYLLWLDGHTIVQTTFCCLYLHDLDRCVKPMPAFAAFVDAFLVACRNAHTNVLCAGIYDDEDFVPSLYGVDLERSAFSTSPAEVLKRAEKEMKGLPAEAAVRLDFMAQYMMALSQLQPSDPKAKRDVAAAGKKLRRCQELLGKMVVKPFAGTRCFDASANRKLLVPGPPRVVKPMEAGVVVGGWKVHVQELLLCIQPRPIENLMAPETNGEPNVLPRSLAHLRGDGVRKRMLESLELHLLPPDALQHCKKATETFLEASESLFVHLLRLAHANRARRFRRLAHVFPELNHLQHLAWQFDDDLKKTYGVNLRYARPCWAWVMDHTLQLMIAKLFLGFELHLYDDAELHMIYWYTDFLFGLRVYNLNEMYHHKELPIGGEKKGSRAADARRKSQQATTGLKPKAPPADLLLLQATQFVVRGLFRLLTYCLFENLIKTPKFVAEGMDQRFVLRFRALEHFRLPHVPSFREFQQSSAAGAAQSPVESRIVIDAAHSSFMEAASLLDKFDKVKESSDGLSGRSLRSVLVANQLAISQLDKVLQAGKRCTISVENKHHPHLVSVSVLPS